MTRTGIAVVAGLLALLAGCGEAAAPTAEPTAAPTAAFTEQEAQFVTMFGSIAGGAAAVNPERVVRRVKNVCLDLGQGKPRAVAVRNAQERFSGPSLSLTTAQAERIVAAAETTVCSAS